MGRRAAGQYDKRTAKQIDRGKVWNRDAEIQTQNIRKIVAQTGRETDTNINKKERFKD